MKSVRVFRDTNIEGNLILGSLVVVVNVRMFAFGYHCFFCATLGDSGSGYLMADYHLVRNGETVGLVLSGHESILPITVDFPVYLRNLKNLNELNSQPLVRAIGKTVRLVVDATAGMGQDSFMLAVAGYEVIGYERSYEVHALLENGLQRAMSEPAIREMIDERLQFRQGDAISELPLLEPQPDAVYLDPMYPPKRRKSALSKKEMEVFRELVGDDDDAAGLFETALASARERVVVKRPHYAEPIGGKPSMSYESKLVRFDVYKVN